MNIDTLQPLSGATARSAVTPEKGLRDENAFLQLLVTQLRNQDPTKPMDPTQTVTQLATFASVEQAIQTNAILSSLADNAAFAQGATLVGRTVTTADGAISGVVKSVTTLNGALLTTLADGRTIEIGPGVVVS